MAAGPIAGTVAVEVVADLTKLDAGLRQGEAAARSSAQTMASDLGKVEAAATGVAQAGAQAAEGLGRVRTASTVTSTLAANMDRATKAANDHAKAVGLSAWEWRNLGFQLNDSVTMLASGSSAMQVVATQGGQVFQVLQGANGGITGALKSMGQAGLTAARGVGVVGGALGVVGSVTVAAVAAGMSYAGSQRELERSLSGVGRASGVTASQITAIARESASAGGVSTRVARDMAGTFASTGRIGSEMLGKLIASTKDYAATTGQDMAEAQAELAKAFADPSKGADDLNSRLGFLNDTTRETIQRLQNQGDRLGAQKALFDAYAASLTKASELTSGWGRITAAVGEKVGTFWDGLGQKVDRVLTGGPIEQQLADARQWLQNAQAQSSSPLGRLFSSRNQSEITQAQAEVDRVQAIIDKREKQTEAAQIGQNSLRIGGIVRSTMPDIEQLQQLEDKVKALREATAQPLKFGLDGNKLTEAVQATETLARRFEAMSRDIERFGSVAVANLNRAADLANRTVGFSPSAKSAAQIEQDYQDRIRVADSREMAGLRRARDTQLDTLRQETYRQSGRYGTSIRDVPEQYRGQVYDAAISQGLDPDLLASVFRRESRFRPDVISGRTLSPAGAIGPFQFMPDTARGMNVNPLDFTSSANGAARFLRERLNARNGDEALALADYNWGLGNVNRVGRDVSRFPRETRGYINEVLRRGPDTAEQVQDQEARTRALENERQQLKLTTEAGGRDAEGLRARVEASQAIANAQARNIDVSKDLAAQYTREAAERSRIVTSERVLQFSLGTQFDREQLGRTAGEQAAYARARSAIGDTDSPAAQAAIQQQTLNDNLRQTKSLANDAFSGMLTDLRQGVSLSASLGNLTGRLADRLLSMASDRVISSLFSGLTGAGANAGGGIMSGIASIFGSAALPKFAVGGITSGPSLAGEAGPEAVIPLSGRASIPVELKGANANTQAPIFQTVVNNNHPSAQVETREVPDGRGGRKQEIVINEAVARGIRSPQGQAALGAPALARR